MEGAAVLPRHTNIPARPEHLVQRFAVGGAPVGAVQKQHVRALGPGELHAGHRFQIVAHALHVLREHLPQLVHPDPALVAVSAHQRVHGHDVHVVVVAQGGFLLHPLAECLVIDDMVAADQARQIEGLGRGVQGHGAVPRVVGHRLGGHVLIAVQRQVRPNLVGHHHDVVGLVYLHGLLDLPALPHPAAGVVGGAEHGGVDMVLLNFPLHVLVVHPPHALLILHQRAEHDVVAVVLQRPGKADVGGRVEQHAVPPGAEHVHGADHAAQHAVFVADALSGKAGDVAALLLPADDGVKIFIAGGEIAEGRVLGPGDHGIGNGVEHGEIHVRHPHGDGVEAVLGCTGGGAVAQSVQCDGVLTLPVQNTGKIVFHMCSPGAALRRSSFP